MVPKRDFTDRFLRALKPAQPGKRIIIYDAQIPGFGLRLSDKSTKENVGAFVLVSRYPASPNPTPRRIGDFPGMPLSRARQIAREWREDLSRGIDPKLKEAERRRQEERRRADTFAAIFEAYAEEHLATLRTGDEVRRAIARYVLHEWGTQPISEIRRADVTALIRNVRKTAPIAANRLLAYLKAFLSWAANEEFIESSPASAVKRLSKEVRRDRVLSELEMRALWHACGELRAFGRPIRMMLASAQRRSEVGGMRWREIDRTDRMWRLARDRTKADRAHEIPLSDLALSIIDAGERRGDFVFPGRGEGPLSGWSKAKVAVDKLAAAKLRELEPDAVFAPWRLHDLRRTAATCMAKLGVDRLVIGKVLNHAEREVTAIYDRHRYDQEKRDALELWSRRLAHIVAGTEDDKVRELAARQG